MEKELGANACYTPRDFLLLIKESTSITTIDAYHFGSTDLDEGGSPFPHYNIDSVLRTLGCVQPLVISVLRHLYIFTLTNNIVHIYGKRGSTIWRSPSLAYRPRVGLLPAYKAHRYKPPHHCNLSMAKLALSEYLGVKSV